MKHYLCTFALAGALSAVGQLLLWAWSEALGANNPFVGPYALATFGLLGFAMALTGIVPHLMKHTVMGVIMPTCGIVMGVANTVVETIDETGDVRTAIAHAAYIPLLVLGGGTVLTIGLRIAVELIAGTALELPFEEVPLSAPIQLIAAFAVGGTIAAVAEGLLAITHLEPPVLMLWIMMFGSALAMFNADAAPVFSNAGFSVSILSAGQGVYDTFGLLLDGSTPNLFIAVMAVFVWVSVLGLVGGLIRATISNRRS